jgi:hypothetical protein
MLRSSAARAAHDSPGPRTTNTGSRCSVNPRPAPPERAVRCGGWRALKAGCPSSVEAQLEAASWGSAVDERADGQDFATLPESSLSAARSRSWRPARASPELCFCPDRDSAAQDPPVAPSPNGIGIPSGIPGPWETSVSADHPRRWCCRAPSLQVNDLRLKSAKIDEQALFSRPTVLSQECFRGHPPGRDRASGEHRWNGALQSAEPARRAGFHQRMVRLTSSQLGELARDTRTSSMR